MKRIGLKRRFPRPTHHNQIIVLITAA
jgi:hypothetical protein